MSDLTKDHLGRELSAEDIVKTLSAMLGWSGTTPWPVLERNLRVCLRRLDELEREAVAAARRCEGHGSP